MALWSIIAWIAVIYAVVVVALWANQRALLYRPWKFLIDPRLCAVSGVELVDLNPANDQRLYAWHLPPKVEGAPVILYFDGNRGNISIWNRRWRRIAAAGAGFIAVSYRGYGGSTQKPSEQGLHEDAALAWAWAKEAYPNDQLVIHGFSLGTGFATKLAASAKTTPLILEGAYKSSIARVRELFPFLPIGLMLKDRIRTDKWIGDVAGPVLLVHGKKDRIVPARHSRALYRLAKEPKTLNVVPEANHLTLPANGLYPMIWVWLNYHPPAPYAEQAYTGSDEDLHTPNAPRSLGRPTQVRRGQVRQLLR